MVVVKPILLLCRFAAGALFFLMMLPAVHDKAWVSAAFLSTAFVTTVYPDSAFRLSWGKRIAIILAAFILGVWFLPDSYDYAWKSAR